MDTLFIGQELLTFDSLSSTNAYAKKLSRDQNKSEGLTILSKYQTSGRGQFGNSWESEKGLNLLFSVYLKPLFLSPDRQFLLNMSVCLAVADSLNEIVPGFEVKWPNDILYDNMKVAGILIENSINSNKLESSIVGIGINVNQQNFETKANITSVQNITGNSLDSEFLLAKVLKQIESRYLRLKANGKGLYNDYYSLLYGFEKEKTVVKNGKYFKIKITGVEPSGQLIAWESAKKRRYNFKEISFLLD